MKLFANLLRACTCFFLCVVSASAQGTCTNETVIDFDNLAVGTIVQDQLLAQGISLLSILNAHPDHPDIAVVFDSENPSGNDPDLGTPNEAFGGPGEGSGEGNDTPLGNIMIVGENDEDDDSDGLVDDPDDEARGGDILFNFVRPTRVKSITFVDTETRGVGIVGFTESNALSFSAEVEALGGNSVQTVDLLSSNSDDSARMLISIRESTAIAEIVICPSDDPAFSKAVKVSSACRRKGLARKRGKKRLKRMGKIMRRRLSRTGKRKLRRGICRY